MPCLAFAVSFSILFPLRSAEPNLLPSLVGSLWVSSHSPHPHALNFPVGFLVDYSVMRVSLTIVHAFYHPLPKHGLPYKFPGGCPPLFSLGICCELNIILSSANVTYGHFNALALTVYPFLALTFRRSFLPRYARPRAPAFPSWDLSPVPYAFPRVQPSLYLTALY